MDNSKVAVREMLNTLKCISKGRLRRSVSFGDVGSKIWSNSVPLTGNKPHNLGYSDRLP